MKARISKNSKMDKIRFYVAEGYMRGFVIEGRRGKKTDEIDRNWKGFEGKRFG